MATASGTAATLQGSETKPWRIDTHHHFFPPRWIAEHGDAIAGSAPGIAVTSSLEWTPQKSLDAMDRVAIEAAILSIPTPGLWFGDRDKARSLVRHSNEFGAQAVRDRPDRFGLFAVLTLQDIEGSLREIEYACDVLHADGFGLITSYDAKWPGDPSFAPVFDELNRRKAVVYFHPTCPDWALNLVPDIPPAITEFVFDTTRAITSLLYSGTLSRCPDIRFIFSHGGGTVPFIAERIASLARRPNAGELRARIPNGVEYEIRKLYYDIVSVAGHDPGMQALMGVAAPDHILFGTDFPFYRVDQVDQGYAKSPTVGLDVPAICRTNALALFPRLGRA